MNSPRVVTHVGLTVNLSQVKAFKINHFTDLGKTNVLRVEFKTRYDYIKNPETNEFELKEFNEYSEIEFPNFEIAETYRDEWIEIWQDYLDEQS